jgi:hypothetical protein
VAGAAVAATVILVAVYVRQRQFRSDSSHGTPAPREAVRDTAAQPTAAPPSVPDSVAAPRETTPATPPAVGPSARRYARTWVNVRGDRARSSPAVSILSPGDAVVVDSLVRGWYRVSVDGRTLGYVYRSMLDVAPPE